MIITINRPRCIHELGQRQNQEDTLYPLSDNADAENPLFLVCDGMGGHEHGEVASQLICSVVPGYLRQHWDGGVLTDDVLRGAVDEVFRQMNRLDDGSARQMGSTLTLLCFHRGGAAMAHIGDSRIYHLRPAQRRILYKSRDHSLVYDLFMAGEISQDEMATHPKKNVITRAVMPGLAYQPKMDIAHSADILPGDYFYLCSDGMLETMNDEELLSVFAGGADEEEIIRRLTEATQHNRDNHSAWIVKVVQVEREPNDATLPHDEDRVRSNAMLFERRPTEPGVLSLWTRIKKLKFPTLKTKREG